MVTLYTSKTLLKTASGRMYTPGLHSTPLDLPLAMSCRNHRKILAYFRYLTPSVFFFLRKGRVKKGGAWHNVPLNTLLHRRKQCIDVYSDGHDKLFCSEIITMINKFKKNPGRYR